MNKRIKKKIKNRTQKNRNRMNVLACSTNQCIVLSGSALEDFVHQKADPEVIKEMKRRAEMIRKCTVKDERKSSGVEFHINCRRLKK